MRLVIVLALVAVMAVAFISGCTQTVPSGSLTEKQMEEQAFQVVDDDMGNMPDTSLDELENELLR